ncbi:hypothetical protein RDABS01_025268 [Bienertia sinuspersici]
MGCVSSKLVKRNLKQKVVFGSGDLPNHVVSLTSSTYGALKLDQKQKHPKTQTQLVEKTVKRNEEDEVEKRKEGNGSKGGEVGWKVEEELEVINTWELMEDLEEETIIPKIQVNQIRRVRRLVDQVSSPKERKLGGKGKENRGRQQCYTTPRSRSKSGLKLTSNSTNNKVRKASSMSMDESPRRSNSNSNSSSTATTRRRSLGPLFDPELIESVEKELSVESSNVVKKKKKNDEKSDSGVGVPVGGENCVVMYTTTLRGIRKTFEECNAVRSAIESYHIRVIERDISMDCGFKEELRKLMGNTNSKAVKVPVVFVKGRLIGGAEEVIRLEEDGKLQGLLQGIPKGSSFNCQGCGGIRFVMCMDCNGSCKLLDHSNNTVLRCAQCNENGLIQCPICC